MSRISYRSHVPLSFVKNSLIDRFPCHREDAPQVQARMKEINGFFIMCVPQYKEKTIHVSENFLLATAKAKDRLSDVILEEFRNSGLRHSGTMIFGDNNVVCYSIEATNEYEKYNFFMFSKDGTLNNAYGYDSTVTKERCYNYFSIHPSNDYPRRMGNDFYGLTVMVILSTLYFKKYANVEIVDSKAKSKQVFAGCKYLNETDFDIEHLDSKWFTSLVNSEGFKVRGFFRMQPKKKDGEWTKELIWIDEFQKNGYNRQAKILTTATNNQ